MSTNPQQQNRSSLLCQEANFVKQISDTRAWATDHTDLKGSFFAMLVVTTKLLDWLSLRTKCLCMQRIVGNKNKVECLSETTIQTSDINKTTQNSTNINDCLPQLNNCIDKQNCNEVKKLVNCFSRETSSQIRICQCAQLIEFEHIPSSHNFRQMMWMWWGGTAQKNKRERIDQWQTLMLSALSILDCSVILQTHWCVLWLFALQTALTCLLH